MDDGFECSCPAEYKGPTCQGKWDYLVSVTKEASYKRLNKINIILFWENFFENLM